MTFAVLVPSTFAPFVGVFVDILRIASAAPFALVPLKRSSLSRALAPAAAIALVVPWESIAETPTVVNLYARGHVYASQRLLPVRPKALVEEPEAAYMASGSSYFDGHTLVEKLLWKVPRSFATLIALSDAIVLDIGSGDLRRRCLSRS